MKTPTVQILIAEGVEEMEAIAPIDLLRRAGATVNILALGNELTITGRNGVKIVADALFSDCDEEESDMIVIPGGPSHKIMLNDIAVLNWIKRHKNSWIASICAGPLVLSKAGILEGKQFTSHVTTANDLTTRITELPVVIDQKLITSQGAGTATAFALELVSALFGKDKAGEIQESISGTF